MKKGEKDGCGIPSGSLTSSTSGSGDLCPKLDLKYKKQEKKKKKEREETGEEKRERKTIYTFSFCLEYV